MTVTIKKKKYGKVAHKKTIKKNLQEAEKLLDGAGGFKDVPIPPEVVTGGGGNKGPKLTKIQCEARLLTLQRLLFRQISTETICKLLNISERMFYVLKAQLKERIHSEVGRMNYPTFVGETMNFFDEVRGMAMIISSDNDVKDKRIKLQAMNVALRAEMNKHEFLALGGVYKAPSAQAYATRLMTMKKVGGEDEEELVDPGDVMQELAKALLSLKIDPAHLALIEKTPIPEGEVIEVPGYPQDGE